MLLLVLTLVGLAPHHWCSRPAELSTIIRSGTVHGPRAIQERLRHMISIVDVDLSPDLSNARVKVSIIGERKDKISAIRWLQSSAGPIRHVMAQELKEMRRVPRLSFVHVDVSKAVDVMVRLDRLAEERERQGGADLLDDGLDFGASDEDAFGVGGGDEHGLWAVAKNDVGRAPVIWAFSFLIT
ncbi:hypothetical protein EMIHUDRAFT_199701 [Emiliania huxleyi CCMP1516]|uniref:Ribosome-binding factor A n=2 Tax=Emiliania huxleyi TaxID=2903 RepID=A0A0D3L029_EMIH1|nr:hypothetical protein EMIHUDRAFT_199701 [Emiliania huxleyi CCMP1516]EOD41364.1 hypothetical protein EMIHUDRAFT_199701 [Emiliania huxleyi CCMP1516]|eukprot:XP_005793793.1 hypothetical protein EMIHUDRAFT_199701 [Emiliania huxleyi CCMP1516]